MNIFFILFYYSNFTVFRKQISCDILFLITAFALDLVIVLRVLVKETLKIFCKDTHKQKYETLKKLKILGDDDKFKENEEEKDLKRQRTKTF